MRSRMVDQYLLAQIHLTFPNIVANYHGCRLLRHFVFAFCKLNVPFRTAFFCKSATMLRICTFGKLSATTVVVPNSLLPSWPAFVTVLLQQPLILTTTVAVPSYKTKIMSFTLRKGGNFRGRYFRPKIRRKTFAALNLIQQTYIYNLQNMYIEYVIYLQNT